MLFLGNCFLCLCQLFTPAFFFLLRQSIQLWSLLVEFQDWHPAFFMWPQYSCICTHHMAQWTILAPFCMPMFFSYHAKRACVCVFVTDRQCLRVCVRSKLHLRRSERRRLGNRSSHFPLIELHSSINWSGLPTLHSLPCVCGYLATHVRSFGKQIHPCQNFKKVQ